MRSEESIFADLAALCVKPGYIHALAHICSRDNIIRCMSEELTEADMMRLYDRPGLIPTEINTLIGLMVKADIDWRLPTPPALQEYIDTTERLCQELHDSIARVMFDGLTVEAVASGCNPFRRGEVLREPIFYGSQSAYRFQYLDLAVRKYGADAEWLQKQRGFTIADARDVAQAIDRIFEKHVVEIRNRMRKLSPGEGTMLPFFAVTVAEVATQAGIAHELVERVLDAFTLPAGECNSKFGALHDFNTVCATPLLRMPSGEFVSFLSYALAEALYDTPYYWMSKDETYKSTLAKHRGDFTEDFVTERLSLVFGGAKVYANVNIWKTKATTAGEIDVLVVWGDRAIIVEAKSKRLTLKARKGNDQVIQDDFRKSVQNAYNQAMQCAQCLGDKQFTLKSADGQEIVLPYEMKEIYIFCVVSDHYPALSFQTRQFLETRTISRVQPPLVMDVFMIDILTEMLQSPLHFLSYVNRRVNYADQLLSSQELTILAYHLKQNLWIDFWIDSGITLGCFLDDLSAGLDVAMAVRRTGIAGAATPDGILTRLTKTALGRIVKEIEARSEPAIIDLGLLLLTLSEDTVKDVSRAIDRLAARAKADGKPHNLTLGFDVSETRLTISRNDDPLSLAVPRLWSYCERHKYKGKASRWYGLCMDLNGPSLRFCVSLSYPWIQSAAMDEATRDMRCLSRR